MDRTVTVMEIRAEVADIRPASAWLEHQGSVHSIPSEQIFRLDLCLNEALANVIEHGGHQAALAPVRLALQSDFDDVGGCATLTISDAGPAFNPLAATPKRRVASLAEATPGGLGLGLISNFCDEVAYEYRQGRNCLRLIVRWSSDR